MTPAETTGSAKKWTRRRVTLLLIWILLCHLMFGTSRRTDPAMCQACDADSVLSVAQRNGRPDESRVVHSDDEPAAPGVSCVGDREREGSS